MAKSVKVGMNIDEELRDRWKEQAKREKRTMVAILELALLAYFEKGKKK